MSIKLLRAQALMSRDLVTISPGDSLRAAARLMTARQVHCLVVPASDPARSVGVITAKDVVQILCDADSATLDQLRVADAMTTPAFCVQQDLVIADCLLLMRMAGVRSVPVLDGLRPVGILSFTDVLRAAAAEGPRR